MYRLTMAIGVVAAACLVIGCGSSGDEATSAPLTKAQFIKQADAICTKFAKKREVAFDVWKEEFAGGIEEAQFHPDAGFKEIVAPSLQQEAEALEALAAPAKDEKQMVQMTESLLKASEDIAANGTAGLRRPSNMADFEDEAEAYGLEVCPDQ
jgi:hypothetical protein